MHKDLLPLILNPSFTLFLAPTGWGKTSLLLNLYENGVSKIIYFSPLRALAEEFSKRVDSLTVPRKKDFKQVYQKFKGLPKGVLIVTPEVFSLEVLEECSKGDLIVLDEIHLFFRWGQSFRPVLEELLYALSDTKASILGLTATMESDLIEQWKNYLNNPFQKLYLLNLGNLQESKYLSYKIFYFSFFKKNFNRRFRKELRKDQTLLYFCQYRQEVDYWLQYCKAHKVSALGCVGGGAMEFIQKLKENPNPRCIFATSTLSHGVNLPDPAKIFISYPVKQKEFWIQMVGRGGRRSKKFEVHTFDDYGIGYGQKLLQSIKHLLV